MVDNMSYFSEVISKDFFKQKVLDGKAFYTEDITTIAGGADEDILLKVGSEKVWLFAIVDADDILDILLYEGTTVSADGTALTINDMNRTTDNTCSVSPFTGPTITADGDLLEQESILNVARSARVGFVRIRVGWLLAANTNYLIRIDNTSGAPEDIVLSLSLFEED